MHSCSKIVQRPSNSLRRASKPLPHCLLNRRCYWLAGPRLMSLWNLEFQSDQKSVTIWEKTDPKGFHFQVLLRLTQTASVCLLHVVPNKYTDRDQLHFSFPQNRSSSAHRRMVAKTRHKSSLRVAESWGTWLKNSDNHKDLPSWNADFGGSNLLHTLLWAMFFTELRRLQGCRTFATQSLRVQLARPWANI